MTVLKAGTVSEADFTTMIAAYNPSVNSYIMAFTPVEFRFDHYQPDPAFLGRTERGRIFSSDGELRWRRLNDGIGVVYLGETDGPDNLPDESGQLEGLLKEVRGFLLWGVRTDVEDEWLEQQVPHRFKYPIATTAHHRGRVSLKVEYWTDASGSHRFHRFLDVEEVKGGA